MYVGAGVCEIASSRRANRSQAQRKLGHFTNTYITKSCLLSVKCETACMTDVGPYEVDSADEGGKIRNAHHDQTLVHLNFCQSIESTPPHPVTHHDKTLSPSPGPSHPPCRSPRKSQRGLRPQVYGRTHGLADEPQRCNSRTQHQRTRRHSKKSSDYERQQIGQRWRRSRGGITCTCTAEWLRMRRTDLLSMD